MMQRLFQCLAVVSIALLAAAPGFAGEGAVGEWKLEIQARQATRAATLVIKAVDGDLEGTWTGPRGEREVSDLKYEDKKLSFTRTISTPNGEFQLDFVATIEGDSLDGTLTTPRGEIPVKGTRVE